MANITSYPLHWQRSLLKMAFGSESNWPIIPQCQVHDVWALADLWCTYRYVRNNRSI